MYYLYTYIHIYNVYTYVTDTYKSSVLVPLSPMEIASDLVERIAIYIFYAVAASILSSVLGFLMMINT